VFDFFSGEIIPVNKPLGRTSFQVVSKVKWAANRYISNNAVAKPDAKAKLKVGHAGTLDPLATGLLLICTGKRTKEISLLQDMEKEYTGTFFLGATTPCFDLEKEVDCTYPVEHITEEKIYEAAKHFTGEQMQEPPAFSAVKVEGQRAYDLARKGEVFEIKPKKITIKEFAITKIEMPVVHFRVVCTKGTYIRSLARDFGKHLQSGAHLTSLCRTRIGEYTLEKAWDLEELVNQLIKQP
jgi:tRNA pseudouridine55 synthase